MKKMILGTIFGFVATISFAALNVNWATSVNTFLYDAANTHLTTDGLLVQLIVDVGNNTDVGSMITSGQLGIGSETALGGVNATASDDIIGTWNSGAWTFYAPSGNHYIGTIVSDTDPNASRRFYFRWFDATSQGSATEAGLIYNSANAWVTPADSTSPSANANLAYGVDANVTGSQFTAGPDDGWATVAPVPEPTTMALMGLGLAAVAVRRKFAKKA